LRDAILPWNYNVSLPSKASPERDPVHGLAPVDSIHKFLVVIVVDSDLAYLYTVRSIFGPVIAVCLGPFAERGEGGAWCLARIAA